MSLPGRGGHLPGQTEIEGGQTEVAVLHEGQDESSQATVYVQGDLVAVGNLSLLWAGGRRTNLRDGLDRVDGSRDVIRGGYYNLNTLNWTRKG